MAYVQFQPPEQFNFRKPDELPHWQKHFEQFRIASGLSTEGKKMPSEYPTVLSR